MENRELLKKLKGVEDARLERIRVLTREVEILADMRRNIVKTGKMQKPNLEIKEQILSKLFGGN